MHVPQSAIEPTDASGCGPRHRVIAQSASMASRREEHRAKRASQDIRSDWCRVKASSHLRMRASATKAYKESRVIAFKRLPWASAMMAKRGLFVGLGPKFRFTDPLRNAARHAEPVGVVADVAIVAEPGRKLPGLRGAACRAGIGGGKGHALRPPTPCGGDVPEDAPDPFLRVASGDVVRPVLAHAQPERPDELASARVGALPPRPRGFRRTTDIRTVVDTAPLTSGSAFRTILKTVGV